MSLSVLPPISRTPRLLAVDLATTLAIAIESLSTTSSASFDIAAFDMSLAFQYPAIVARARIGTPIVLFFAVANPRHFRSIYFASQDRLRGLNLFRPAFDHGYAAIHHFWPIRGHIALRTISTRTIG